MIGYEEALSQILDHTPTLPVTTVKLKKMLGSVLAEPVVTPFALPRFSNSAMDGYGVRVDDVVQATEENPARLRLQETVQAGDRGEGNLTPGNAIRIFTGAPIPEGVEAVVMQEYCTPEEDHVLVRRPAKAGDNIRFQGEEYPQGTQVLSAGTRVTPPVVGVLATLGYAAFPVYTKPSVAFISTGNELVKPGEPLRPGEIYDSNTYALRAALQQMDIPKCKVYHVPDERDKTLRAFQKALKQYDVVISLGGVSVGDFDFVTDVMDEAGVDTVFWKIAMKPGKPVYFGVKNESDSRKLVFGLPGNPVSALVTFHQLVQPALLKMMGVTENPAPPRFQAVLMDGLRKKPGRLEFVRGRLSCADDTWQVTPTSGQESHMLGGLAQANCLILFDAEQEALSSGACVQVIPFSWQP